MISQNGKLAVDGLAMERRYYGDFFSQSSSMSFDEEDTPIPKPQGRFRTFEEILADEELANDMFPPDYFMLVE